MSLLTDEELTQIRHTAVEEDFPPATVAEIDRIRLLKHIKALTIRLDASQRGENELAHKLALEYIARGRQKLWSQTWRESAKLWKKTANDFADKYAYCSQS